MITSLGNRTILEHQDQLTFHDGRKSVGDGDRRPSLTQTSQIGLYFAFGAAGRMSAGCLSIIDWQLTEYPGRTWIHPEATLPDS